MAQDVPDIRWRTALEAVADGVWDWDLQTGETRFSPQGLAMWGYDPAGPTPDADEIFSRVHPEDLPVVQETIRGYLSGTSDRYEARFRVVDPAGPVRWILGRGCAVERDAAGKPVRMLGTNVDITEQEKAEARLRMQQAQMETAQELARVGYWTYDIGKRQPAWSEMMFQVLGCDPEKGVPDFQSHREFIHPEDWARFDSAVQEASLGKPYDLELRVLFPDQTIHYVRAKGYPEFDADGQVASVFGVTQDITQDKEREEALREQERLFRDTFEQAAVGMVQGDLDGSWIRVNRRLSELLGYEPDELMKLDYPTITHPDDRALSRAHFQRIIEGTEEVDSWRKRYLRKDGSILWAQLTGSLIRDEKGAPAYYLGIIVDLTRQVEAEQQSEESKARLRALAEKLDQVRENERAQLSREIHDDLGQHMTAVRMDLDRLAADYGALSPGLRERIREMGLFLDQGIQISRNISSGLRSPVLELLGLTEAVRATAEEMIQRSGMVLNLDLPPEEPAGSDRQQNILYSIVKEALANVLKHSEASNVWVSVRSEEGVVLVSVKDDGKGIPAQVLENPRSFGLLSMIERARSIGATCTVETPPGGGTRILVIVPAAEPA